MMGLTQILSSLGIPMKTHLEVLVYQTRVTPQVYMVYVVPRDASMVQAVKEEMKRLAPDARRIITNQPCMPLWLNTKLCLKASAPESRISPPAFTLRFTRPMIPRYFEVVIRNAESSFDLELVSEGQSIWEATLWDHEYGHAVEEADDIREVETWLKRDRPNGEKEEATLQDIVGDEVEESNAIRKVKAWLQWDDNMPGNYDTHLSDKAKHDSAKSDSGYGSSRGKSVMSGPQSEDGAVGGGDLCEVSSVYSQGISDIVSEVPSEEDWVESGPQSTVEPPMNELKRVRHAFIARTNASVLGDLVSLLKSHDPPVLNNSEADVILQSSSVLRNQATTLIDMVLNKGNKACAVMLSLLKELDWFLCEDLKMNT